MKKICSWLLVLAMLVTWLPAGALAAGIETGETGRIRPEVQGERSLSELGLRDRAAQTLEQPQLAEDQIVDIIVLLDDSRLTATPSAGVRQALLADQAGVQREISREVLGGVPLEVGYSYTTLVNGFSASVTYGQLREIRELEGVKSAFIAPCFELVPDMGTSNSMVGGGTFNETGYHGEGMLIAILDTGVDMTHEMFRDTPEEARLTRTALQNLLDTEELQCESLVSGVGASTLYHNGKIPFQFDYGDKDANGAPPASGGEHGTHVAATAAGNDGVNSMVMGVAPEAQVINMKVFKASGGASYDDILAALEDCMLLGVDAVNMSLGSTCGFIDYESQDEWTMNLVNVFNRVGESGISMAVAVGNDYSAAYNNNYGGRSLASNPDYGNASEPATYDESLAIASVENCGILSPYITVAGRDIAYYDGYDADTSAVTVEYAFRTLGTGEKEYVMVPGAGAAEDYEGLDVTGKIAVVQRGGTYYEVKARNAAAAGAVGLIVYNNQPGMVYMSMSAWSIPVAFISQADGAYLAQQENRVLTIAAKDALVTSPVTGMSDFSSWGATSELTLKPELSAPGGNIYSAIPGNQYELMSGTSMASPHVAGGMAIVKGAVEDRFPGLTDGEQKDLVDTLLMCTAAIVYDGDTPVSPRKQGAGLMDINAAAGTPAYITVAGMERPKLELKDDPQRSGVYNLTFTVHNTTDAALTYKAYPIVITDDTTTYTNAGGESVVTMTETSVPLDHTFTTNFENNLVTVPANGEAQVTITVTLTDPKTTLAAFPNGAFVEGWAVLEAVHADGSETEDGIALHAPFLAFYGDWTEAPIIDAGFYYHELDGETSQAQTYSNSAIVSSLEGYTNTYLGDNNYALGMGYLADRNAISPNHDDFMDSLTYVYTGMLRSARHLRYTVTGPDGTVYYAKDVEYEPKSVYDNNYFQVVPAGVNDYDAFDPWYGTDATGSSLPNNAKATVRVEAELIYDEHEANNQRSAWEFPITIDTEEPQIQEMTVRESEGRYYATLTLTDNQYVAAVVLTDPQYSKEFDVIGVAETTPGATTVLKDLDITGMGESIGLVVHDYAGNSKAYTLKATGNSDDYAEVVPTDILWQENFNSAWLPDGWTVESRGQSVETWHRDEEYMATCSYDENFEQNEWLITPVLDISGQQTETHFIFDFNTVYAFTTHYKRCDLLVMASVDGGETWEKLWDLWDVGVFADWTNTQAKVTFPEKFQNSPHIQFAFVYQGKDGAMISIDNVIVYADLVEDYAAITACAGENGSVSPEGRVLVKKGNSKTITVTPDEGYRIASVTVDGVDMGPISYYTFERIGVDHTITAAFAPEHAGGQQVLFENDFEGDSFPGNGWSLKTTNSSFTWYSGKQTNLNATKVARVDFDEYEYEDWSQAGLSPLGTGAKQDEYLITPAVNLTGKTPTLRFDYAFGRYALFNGTIRLTVEASTDGGSTWTSLWNAKEDLENESGYTQSGTCELAIPEEFCTADVQFAFRFYKTAYTGGDPAAVDNVSLTVPGGAGETGHTLRAAATEGGTIAPTGDTVVADGASQTFTLMPDENCRLVSLRVNGRAVDVTDSYTLEHVDQSYYLLATFEAIEEEPQVIFEQDFEGPWIPAGWSVEGVNTDFTWKQYKYYYFNGTQNAYITADYSTGAAQDERLVTPTVDLTGATKMELDFAYAYPYYGMKSGEFTFTLEISKDGGGTWTTVWDAKDTIPPSQSGYVVTGQAAVEIPEAYGTSGVTFAFHYTRPAGENTGIAAVDNLKLLAVGGQTASEYTITATAGTGGAVTPSGTVLVAAHGSQTFAVTADAGYEIADVTVDGQSVGAVAEYTFQDVTRNHTIHAAFRPAGSVMFDNDFEDDAFPGRGWRVKTTNADYTWTSARMSQLNGSKVAKVSYDAYDSDTWSGGAQQDEYLISPAVDLTGKHPVVKFDYAFGRYEVFYGGLHFTVEASTDGGDTWTTLWDASKDLENGSGYYQTGTCELTVPEEFRTDNVQLAFHYFKKAGDTADPVAVDNVTLSEATECPHTNSELRDAREATCTEPGYTGDTYCKDCGALLSQGKEIEALGHDFSIQQETVAPTCTEEGYTIYRCSRCGATEHRDVVPATGHTGELRDAREATCTESGYTGDTYCSVCGVLLQRGESIPPLGHDYEDVVIAPTCTEDGYTEHTCTRCGDSYRDSYTDAQGHLYEKTVTEATCETMGYTTYVCSVCEHSYVGAITPPLGHDYENVVVAPTCTKEGYTEHTCARCGDSYRDGYTDALGHQYEAIVTEATCETMGYTTYVCAACEHSYIGDLVQPLGHQYEGVVTEPTCDEMGYTTYTCTICGHSYVADYVSAHDHRYTASVTREATCVEEGIMTFTCTDCGKTYTQTIPMTSHSCQSVVVEPTCEEFGYTEHTCTVCGYRYISEITQPTGHHEQVQNAKEATCTEPGYTGDAVCTDCGKVLCLGESIPAKGHSWSDWEVTQEADCFHEGERIRSCALCGESERENLPVSSEMCPSKAFVDLDTARWYHAGVDYVLRQGIMEGVGGNRFQPDGALTRGQIVTILYRMANSPSVSGKFPFTDVKEGRYYTEAVAWAYENGVVLGMTDTLFAPEAPVTREQLVTFLYRYAKLTGADITAGGSLEAYPDAGRISTYAAEAFAWAVEKKLVNGMGGQLVPKATATRAQVATILLRYSEAFG